MYLFPSFLFLATMITTSHAETKTEGVQSSCPVVACNSPGLNGLPGRDGCDGAKGEKGEPVQGIRGIQGPSGKAGPVGMPGIPGLKGEEGQKGAVGPKGDPGEIGEYDTKKFDAEIAALQSHVRGLKKWVFFSMGKHIRNKFYVSIPQFTSPESVEYMCTELQTLLATPMNDEENLAIQNVAKDIAYFGTAYQKTKTQFLDLRGSRVKSASLYPGQLQNDGQEEDCEVLLENRNWDDDPCPPTTMAVCEFYD